MAPAVGILVDTLLQLGRQLCFLAFCGMAFSSISLNKILKLNIPDHCTPTWFEYTRTWVFSTILLECSISSVIVLSLAKFRVAVRDEADAAATLVTRRIIVFAQVVLIAGFTSAGLMMFYLVQLMFGKFSCIGTGTQAALVGFMSTLAILLLLFLHSMNQMAFDWSPEFTHARLMQVTPQKDEVV